MNKCSICGIETEYIGMHTMVDHMLGKEDPVKPDLETMIKRISSMSELHSEKIAEFEKRIKNLEDVV